MKELLSASMILSVPEFPSDINDGIAIVAVLSSSSIKYPSCPAPAITILSPSSAASIPIWSSPAPDVTVVKKVLYVAGSPVSVVLIEDTVNLFVASLQADTIPVATIPEVVKSWETASPCTNALLAVLSDNVNSIAWACANSKSVSRAVTSVSNLF